MFRSREHSNLAGINRLRKNDPNRFLILMITDWRLKGGVVRPRLWGYVVCNSIPGVEISQTMDILLKILPLIADRRAGFCPVNLCARFWHNLDDKQQLRRWTNFCRTTLLMKPRQKWLQNTLNWYQLWIKQEHRKRHCFRFLVRLLAASSKNLILILQESGDGRVVTPKLLITRATLPPQGIT